MTSATYEQKKSRLITSLQERQGGDVRLGKNTSNLFRDRKEGNEQKLDVRDFNTVIKVDVNSQWVEVEGMTPFSDLVHECLKYGVMPTVVPQLKSITIGGAATGCGIESSSFKYGLVHETVKEIEILLADGSVVQCTPENEYKDLFFGFPNSYGTLGYALKLKVQVVPVTPYVRMRHIRFSDPEDYFREMAAICDSPVDFVDGTIFGPQEMYITVGSFVDEAPYTSDYTYKKIYYRSIREREQDYLTIGDYIWRWDTDWFWCSRNLCVQNPVIRRLVGKKRLNSVSYTKVMRWNSKWRLMTRLNKLLGRHSESVIQDVEMPINNAPEYFRFYNEHIKFMPVWVCPTRAYKKDISFDLYRMDPEKLYVNFGFWDVITTRKGMPEGYHNRLIEKKIKELDGNKSLYSDAYYTKEEFWQIYNKPAYERLKKKYDAGGRFKDLFAKCVLRE